MQSFRSENMGTDQIVDRLQRDRAGPDLIGQRRKADLDPFFGIAFGLPVQGLVLAELLKENHGQQVWPRPPAGCGMERGWRLADLLALPAGELLADGLDDFPLPGNDLQSLGDVFAHLHDARRPAAAAGGRGFDHHALTGQMFREGLAGGTAAFESGDRGLRGERVSLGTIFPKVCLEILELHLELLDQPGMAFGAVAILFTPEFGDLQSQVPDHILSR